MNCAGSAVSGSATGSGAVYNFSGTYTPASPPPGVAVAAGWSFKDNTGFQSYATVSSTGVAPSVTFHTNGTHLAKFRVYWLDTAYTGHILCRDSTTISVNVTGATPPVPTNNITGRIYWDSSLTAGNYNTVAVWLIKYDTASQSLTAVDSQITQAYTGYRDYSFFYKPSGTYRVKAHITNQPSSAGIALLPTYADSALYWNSANAFYHSGGTTAHNIWLKKGTAASGPGFIGGSVLAGANKGTASGDPVTGQLMLIRNSSGALVRSAVTNSAGNYSFPNLPVGAYTVYPEAINYATTPSDLITLSGFQNTANGYNFRKSESGRTFTPFRTTSVVATARESVFTVAPNPSSGKITIVSPVGAGASDIVVTALSGQLMHRQSLATGGGEIDLSALAPGFYDLTIQSTLGATHNKLIIQR